MKDRTKQKEKTHQKLLSITKEIYLDQGYINTSTKVISKKANVSQGTIFLHFETKQKLLATIIVDELDRLFYKLQETSPSIDELFLSIVDNERLLSRVMKDYPCMPERFQTSFDQVRMGYKDQLFDLLKPKSKLSILDLFALIEMVLALIFEDLFYAKTDIMVNKIKKYQKIIKKYS
ncbi:MAG: TetR/AcrR family transcriptional regulator [Candidatus Izemoplasmataceae bacterium]